MRLWKKLLCIATALATYPLHCYAELPSFLTLNDALVETLANQKQIQISFFNITNQEGVLQQSAAPFDAVLNESVADIISNNFLKNPPTNPPTHLHFKSNDVLAQGNLIKQTRAGTVFSLSNVYEFFSDGHKVPSTRASQIVFQIDQPLLRNFLHGLSRQIEIANSLELQAVKWDTLQTISNVVFNTILAYWEVVAAKQNANILKEAVDRLEKLRVLNEKLIAGEQLAAADLNQTIALIDTQTLAHSQANGNLYSVQQQLLFTMGALDDQAGSTFEKKFILEDETLPPLLFNEVEIAGRKDYYIEKAFSNRFDILASLSRQEALQALVVGAENETLPKLDLVGSITLNDLNPLFQSASITGDLLIAQESGLIKNRSTNYSIGLALSVPFQNDAAKGALKQSQARFLQIQLQTQYLKQNVISLILQTLNNQIVLHRQWEDAAKVADKYTRLIQDETTRLQTGFGSIFNLLSFESNLINIQTIQTNIAKQYIQGISQMRYLTGALIVSDDDTLCQINIENLLSYPY